MPASHNIDIVITCKLYMIFIPSCFMIQDEDCLRTYVHIGTGNYNPRTAAVYTDFGLFRYQRGAFMLLSFRYWCALLLCAAAVCYCCLLLLFAAAAFQMSLATCLLSYSMQACNRAGMWVWA